jgi:hypothetical protein
MKVDERMPSAMAEALKLRFEPVALIWSDWATT